MENILSFIDFKTVIGVLGAYFAIRADIKNIYTRLTATEKDVARVDLNSVRAHQRIDEHINDHARVK